MKYFKSITVTGTNIGKLRATVEEELKMEGFGVLTEIDLQATMKKKLNKDYPPHLILGACNPVYADKVLSIDPNISAMLPCNVTLRELEDGKVEVAAIDPLAAMGTVGNPSIEGLAKEINDKLDKVLLNVKNR
jgi:uncharacterized protein (DUF302 family)